KRLRGPFPELHVRNALALRFGPAARERAAVWIDGEHRGRIASGPQREPALARADVGDAKPPKVEAVRGQLDLGRRPEVSETTRKNPSRASRTAHLTPEASHQSCWPKQRRAADP